MEKQKDTRDITDFAVETLIQIARNLIGDGGINTVLRRVEDERKSDCTNADLVLR